MSLFPWASGRPRKLSARCATVESEIVAEVIPRKQRVDFWFDAVRRIGLKTNPPHCVL